MSYSDDDRLADQRGQLTNPLPDDEHRRAMQDDIGEAYARAGQDARGMDNQGERIRELEGEVEVLVALRTQQQSLKEAAEAERDQAAQALWDIWAAYGHDTDGDRGPAAHIAGMGTESWARSVVDDMLAVQRDNEAAQHELQSEVTRLSRWASNLADEVVRLRHERDAALDGKDPDTEAESAWWASVGRVEALIERKSREALEQGYTEKGLDYVLVSLRDIRAALAGEGS